VNVMAVAAEDKLTFEIVLNNRDLPSLHGPAGFW
jgi:hypothetical protein